MKINLGIVGFGGFAMFAVQQFIQVPGVKISGISETHRTAAKRAAERFGAGPVQTIDEMLTNDEINLVYISTPPFLHYEHSIKSLKAGKNVIVEKPLALTKEQADEMISIAEENDLVLSVNLMQRYNPLYEKIDELIRSKAMGNVLHGYFENYASDENLNEDHWFWDRTKSGGIFIEHGVHFFDMVEGWLGKGNVISSYSVYRNDDVVDQVGCTVAYGGIPFNFYHGFTQAARMDRQEMRLLFDKGDVTLYEWIPVRIKLHAVSSEAETRIIHDLFPHSRIDMQTWYNGNERNARSGWKEYEVYQRYDLYWNEYRQKMHVYGELLRSMLTDQIRYIEDKKHKRKVTHENGRTSLLTALDAQRMSENLRKKK